MPTGVPKKLFSRIFWIADSTLDFDAGSPLTAFASVSRLTPLLVQTSLKRLQVSEEAILSAVCLSAFARMSLRMPCCVGMVAARICSGEPSPARAASESTSRFPIPGMSSLFSDRAFWLSVCIVVAPVTLSSDDFS